jgi:hypothetical protein
VWLIRRGRDDGLGGGRDDGDVPDSVSRRRAGEDDEDADEDEKDEVGIGSVEDEDE